MENEKIPNSAIEMIEIQLQRHEKSIEELSAQIHLCQLNDATVNVEIKQVLQGISELKQSVLELKEKPAKRWDSVITTIVTSIVSGVVGVVLGIIFSK